MQSAHLEPGKRPKFYQIHLGPDLLGGWVVVREWGHQGSSGRVMQDHFKTFSDAENAVLATRETQVKRGYRVVFVQGENRPVNPNG